MSYIYNFNKEKCWYKKTCNKFNDPEHCNKSCIRYLEMDYLMFRSLVPEAKQYGIELVPEQCDIKSFEFLNEIKNDIKNFVDNGENLYIFSSHFGNGKTSWAIKILTKFFNDIWSGNGFQTRGIFLHVPTFLTKIKSNIGMKDVEFEKMREELVTVDLVVWDDIASTGLSDFDHTNLLTYIDIRKMNDLANIYTGNLNDDEPNRELSKALGNRLASRVWQDSTLVELLGSDRRGSC